MKKYLKLFLTFLKIGAFTFGGGYAMIPLIRTHFVEKTRSLSEEEFTEILSIAESTPGPLAINLATFVGYKTGKFWGALISTVAVVIPSFVIIFVISLFLDRFMQFTVVQKAFKGIQCAVAIIITFAGINMLKDIERRPLAIILFLLSFAGSILIDIFAVNFSTVFFILFGALCGVIVYLISKGKKKNDLS
jgi:chromate transporter